MPSSIYYQFDRFIITHFIIPSVAFVLIFSSLELTSLDYQIARIFFDPINQTWPWRNHWLTKTVLHDWGQIFDQFLIVLLLITLIAAKWSAKLKPYFKLLVFLFIASISGPIFISILKNFTHIYCPWDLTLFGGDKPYVRLFDFPRVPLAVGHCFPASHAAGGYALVSLYFFLLVVKPEYRYFGLAAGLLIGLIFGITQQFRGAHFLSHDIFSLAICWFSSLTLFAIFFWRNIQWQ